MLVLLFYSLDGNNFIVVLRFDTYSKYFELTRLMENMLGKYILFNFVFSQKVIVQ